MHTYRSDMTNPDLAAEALRAVGVEFRRRGHVIRLISGDYSGTRLDLSCGNISTTVGRDKVGLLRQHYAEAKYKAECARMGIKVVSRYVESNGDIVLMCRTT